MEYSSSVNIPCLCNSVAYTSGGTDISSVINHDNTIRDRGWSNDNVGAGTVTVSSGNLSGLEQEELLDHNGGYPWIVGSVNVLVLDSVLYGL